jgi:hypothetical protein
MATTVQLGFRNRGGLQAAAMEAKLAGLIGQFLSAFHNGHRTAACGGAMTQVIGGICTAQRQQGFPMRGQATLLPRSSLAQRKKWVSPVGLLAALATDSPRMALWCLLQGLAGLIRCGVFTSQPASACRYPGRSSVRWIH